MPPRSDGPGQMEEPGPGEQPPSARVAIYTRVSTEAQASRGTIASQLEALQAHVASIGAEVVATYIDDGYSGARLDRPGLDAARDAAEAGVFEQLWCLCPDRLARSFPYQVLVIDELARFGVQVRFTDSPPLDDDPQARLLIQMQGVIAEYERAKLAERSRRGKLYRVRAGEAVFGRAPYGYRRIPRSSERPAHLVIYEPEAVVARRIFAEYVSGTSLRQIALGLFRDGVPTATGKPMWAPAMLTGLVTNPTYKGKAAWYRTEHVTPPGGGKTQRRRRPAEEWVEVDVPAIVTEDVFAAAQAARATHKAFSARNTSPGQWLLRQLVVCGPCGTHTRAQKMTSSSGGKINRYYSCARHDLLIAGSPERVCRQQRIRADELDELVYQHIRQVLLRPDMLLAGEAATAGAHNADDNDLLDAQIQRVTRRLEQTDLERRRLADLYQAGIIDTPELRRRHNEITARKTALEAEQAQLAAQHQQAAGHNQIRQRLTNFAAAVTDGFDRLDFDARQRLLRLVIEQIRVTGTHVEIRLRIPLDGEPPDNQDPDPNNPETPTPTTTSRRHPTTDNPVSTKLRCVRVIMISSACFIRSPPRG